MTTREKVARAINPNDPDIALRTGIADAAIAAHLEELRLGTIARLAKQIANPWARTSDQRAALDILAILERAGVDV
ncbi:hypothetical protein [Mycolicibacterium houstonense]|uniref:hypothetical protein n=1 Tax=Mycolicibacterium houstonense TaxID=146021 RepID=UPI000832085D|nr:hypothetical protein [Mycolicibacterium houstonense]